MTKEGMAAVPRSPEARREQVCGPLRRRLEAFWASNYTSRLCAAYMTGGGFIRVEWSDGAESGVYHLPVTALSESEGAPQ
jgi:hypothetical protein